MRDGSEGQERKKEMITREDFLDHGFKAVYKPYKTSFWIRLSKDEIPPDLRKSTDGYQIQTWTSIYVDGNEKRKIDIVVKKVKGECIIYGKGGLWIHTEWADGDERLRHAYVTNCNSEYYWNEYCPLDMDFDGLVASYLECLQNKKKNSNKKYRKETAKLKKEHEREINDLNKKITALKETLK